MIFFFFFGGGGGGVQSNFRRFWEKLDCLQSKFLRFGGKGYYRFSRPFSSSLHSILENVLSISSRILWNLRNARFNFVFGRSILKHCHTISCFVTHFVNCNWNSSVTVAEHETAKNNFVYRHSFSSKFQSNSSPRCRGPITLDEFEWQNTEFVWRNDEFDPTFLTRLATQTNFSDNWRIWMLNF